MENEILFKERQKFNQWWIWLILLGLNGLSLFSIYYQVMVGQQFGNNPMSNTGLIFTFGVTLLITILFLFFRLDSMIKKDGIYIRLFPFQIAFKHHPWDSISKSYIRQYKPLAEYGGWGIRIGLFGKGKAFNISGRNGLQLEFTDDTKLLIGTNKPVELEEILNKIGQIKQ
jgi:hypothetical protein